MEQVTKKEEFNLRELIKPYVKKWKWFFLSTVLLVFLAYLYVKHTTPVYKIKSSVLIKDAKKMASGGGEMGGIVASLSGLSTMGTNSIQNEMEIFKSKKIIEDVVKNLKLQTAIYSRERFYDVELYKDTNPINIYVINEKPFEDLPKKPINIKIEGYKITLSSKELKKNIVTTFNKTISLPYANFIITKNPDFNRKKVKQMKLNDLYFTYSDFESTVFGYQNTIGVDLLDKDATIIGLYLNYINKDKGKDILDNVVKIYNGYAISDKNVESKKTKDFIDDRINIISKELGEVEDEKEKFKKSNDIVDLVTEAKLNLEVSSKAEGEITKLDTQIELANMLINYIDSPANNFQVLPTNIGMDPSMPSSATVNSNMTAYNTAIMQRSRLLENATPENPLVIDNARDINSLKNALRESLVKSKNSIEISKANLAGEKGSIDDKISKIPFQEKLFRSIERQQELKEKLYLLLLEKREEAAISMAITADKARVVDNAYSSNTPVSPKKMLTLLGALILGLLIPFSIIYVSELMNDKITTKHELDKLIATSVLAEIPRMSRRDNQIIQQNDVSPLAEAFRILITNIRFMLPKKDNAKIIFVTSTVKGEGKTFISINLSLALASPRGKVLVIGSDIRNPQLQRYNPTMKGAKGLTEFLHEDIDDVKSIIHPSGFNPNCDFIYSGAISPNPTALLQNGRYEQLLDFLKDEYQYIVLDTAPLMLVTDSFLISEVADATIYVTRSEISQKVFIDFANKNIEEGKIKNVGFVLNDIHKTNFGYGNKYGYGYQVDEKKWWKRLFG